MNVALSTRLSAAFIAVFIAHFVACDTALAFDLELIQARWEKDELQVAIRAAGSVSETAIIEVMDILDEWNMANLLAGTGAPQLVVLDARAKQKDADVVIQMKGGGGNTFGVTSFSTANPFSCELTKVRISLSGKAFGLEFSDASRRNTARHEIGHLFSLGHTDDPTDLMFATGGINDPADLPISDLDLLGVMVVYGAETCEDILGFVSSE